MSPRFLIAAGVVSLLAAPAFAQPATPPAAGDDAPPQRMSQLVVFGNDPCPRSRDDEIVVCARLPENERYRVPKRFRGKHEHQPAPDTWTNRVSELETVSRAGTPNSCSVVGSGGQTGCYQKFLHEAYQDRQQAKAEAAEVP